MNTDSKPGTLPFALLTAIDIRQTDRLAPKKGISVEAGKAVVRGEWRNTVHLRTATQIIELTAEQATALGAALYGAAGLKYGPTR